MSATSLIKWSAGLLLVALGFWLAVTFSSDEPSHEGRPVSSYLQDFTLQHKNEEAYARATNAIAEMGTNALPFLISEATVSTPFHSEWFTAHVNRFPARLRGKLGRRFGSWNYEYRRRSALAALQILGEKAAPAADDLIEFFPKAGPNDWWMLTDTLSKIGSDAVGLLIPYLESEDAMLRRQACFVVHQLASSPKAVLAVPALIDGLMSPDPNYRNQVVHALARIGQPAIPAMEKAMSDAGPQLLERLLHTVQLMSSAGRPLTPTILELLGHEEPTVRSRAAIALCHLWPFIQFDESNPKHETFVTMMREKAAGGEPMFVWLEQAFEQREAIVSGLKEGLSHPDPSIQMDSARLMVRHQLNAEQLLAVLNQLKGRENGRWKREVEYLINQLQSRHSD